MNHLIAVTPMAREGIWKANLRLLAGLISVWGPSLSLAKMDLLHMLNKKDESSKSTLSTADRVTATCEFFNHFCVS